MDKHFVDIKLLGTSFKIEVDENPAYMQDIINYLKVIINKIENSTGMHDPLKIAILASIYLTDEIYKGKNSEKELSELTEKIISCIENVLEDK
ncbi:MAG: cell division protein ZapA [Spirochaetes bacterium]|nr:cell division protein ZapA [Spirochaetota bacterium]